MVIKKLRRVSPVLPAPTLTANGRPTRPWVPSSITRADWGTPTVIIDGTDVTEFRGARTVPRKWSYTKPHWYGDAELLIPRVSTYEALPAWLDAGKDVQIQRRLPDGMISTDIRDTWRGYVTSVSEADNGMTLATCQGLYQQLDLYVRAPGLRDEAHDVGFFTKFNLESGTHRPNVRWPNTATEPTTGKDTRYRGNWERLIEYLITIWASLPGWSLRPTTDTAPEFIDTLVSPGNTYTVRYAVGHIDCDFVRDLRGSPNVIYAEGVVNGVEWRRMVVVGDDPIFIPLASDPRVNTFFMGPDGELIIDDTEFDASLIRQEIYWKLPAGITMEDAETFATEWLDRVTDPGWAGQATLHVHPEEAHLLDLRPDDILVLKGYRGEDQDLHVSEVSFTWDEQGEPYAELVLDTNARDLATITALLGLDGHDPDYELANNPFARVQIGKDSGIRKDRTAQWDFNGGSGYVPNDDVDGRYWADGSTFTAAAGDWTVKRFLASEADAIARTEIVLTSDGTYAGIGKRFVAVVCDRLPGTSLGTPADRLPADPMADGAWESDVVDPDSGYLWGWGGSFRDPATGGYVANAAGYGNIASRFESAGDPVTGQMLDQTTWQYTHEAVPDDERLPAFLWLAIFNLDGADGECWARFVRGPANT